MKNYKSAVNIREIQHFHYCPHRWGLIEIDMAWAENYYVVKSTLQHERVHSISKFTKNGTQQFMAVPVWNDEYNLYGVLDCLEMKDNKFTIVEHKSTKPKNKDFSHADAMQVFAQKVCVDFVFNTKSKAYIYYADIKKRIELPFDAEYEKYDNDLKETIHTIKKYFEIGKIPPIEKNQNCSGCSMKDLCMPKLKFKGVLYKNIAKNMREV